MTESDAPYSLEELRKYLLEPVFTLYLGRKSCPPALPLNPQIFEAKSLMGACELYPSCSVFQRKSPQKFQIFWEEGIEAGVSGVQSELRRDQLLSRKRWQYFDRIEYRGLIELSIEEV
jgi:CRISPR system Cascade subunit CasD